MKEAETIHTAHKDTFRHRYFLLLLIPSIVFALTLVFIVRNNWQATDPLQSVADTRQQVKVSDTLINVRLAKTADEHTKGLSGVQNMEENEGMLFVFPGKVRPAFWMKDMLIPLDFIWITDNKVSQIDADAKAPDFGTPDGKLKLYIPNDLVDYVLEVNSGFTKAHNIKVGDTVVVE